MKASVKRRITKTVIWRIIATIITAGVGYVVTGSLEIAAEIGLADAGLKFIGYYLHERYWEQKDRKARDSGISGQREVNHTGETTSRDE